jgi:gluconate 2-dehydrogenase gamma chain
MPYPKPEQDPGTDHQWTLPGNLRAIVGCLAECIFPATDDYPGAIEIGVAEYIENQLADAWGEGAGLYLDGPFVTSADSGHGWQEPFNPRGLYVYGLTALDEYCVNTYRQSFTQLDKTQQNRVVMLLEKDDLDTFTDVSAAIFFAAFYECVLEGLFADPLYGGNKRMLGWRWIRYPGCQPAYGVDYSQVGHRPGAYLPEPVSLPPRSRR